MQALLLRRTKSCRVWLPRPGFGRRAERSGRLFLRWEKADAKQGLGRGRLKHRAGRSGGEAGRSSWPRSNGPAWEPPAQPGEGSARRIRGQSCPLGSCPAPARTRRRTRQARLRPRPAALEGAGVAGSPARQAGEGPVHFRPLAVCLRRADWPPMPASRAAP